MLGSGLRRARMEGNPQRNRRLVLALGAYAVLAAIAVVALDGFVRAAVLLLFALLAVKTVAHAGDEPMP